MESCHFHVFLKCHSWLCDFTFTTLTAKSISIYSLPWLLTLPLCPRFFKNCRNGKVSYWKPKHRKKRYLVYSEKGIQWHVPYVWICKGTCAIVLFSWISHNQISQLHRDFFFFFLGLNHDSAPTSVVHKLAFLPYNTTLKPVPLTLSF